MKTSVTGRRGPTVRREAPAREDAKGQPPNPLALDPYSPIAPARAPERNGADPLALSPYSPIAATRTPADRRQA